MSVHTHRVELAIKDLQQGKLIILTDDPNRENEGDLICPAENITAEMMNFIIRNSSGIVCLSLMEEQLKKLALSFMVTPEENTSLRGTPFTVSIDAKEGVTTGVSAADRVETILAAVKDNALPGDLVKPGHVFPLQAKAGGVLQRAGHTEGGIDIVRLAGFKPAAVLCEVMDKNGEMARGKNLEEFARIHQIQMVSIEELITYRLQHENLIEEEVSANLPLHTYGNFKISVIKEKITGHEHVVLENKKLNSSKPPLVRIHSSCLTGDLFSSLRCDCHQQLHYSLQRITKESGVLIYLNQEGRGIGLLNKIKAYSLQESGVDTVEANQQLGLPADSREYYIAANILRNRNMNHIRLLTNNPGKISDLKKYGISEVILESMPAFFTEHNKNYLNTKKEKLMHLIG